MGSIDYQWDADLVDMVTYESANDGYKYILVGIDILSRHLWTRPLKNKQGAEVVRGFKDIFDGGERKPQKVRTDKGQEFKAKVLQKFFKDRGVDHFVTQNEVKAIYAERVIKTLKSRIMRYFTLKQTHRWIDVLDDFTDSYNKTYHRSIKTSPRSVNKANEVDIWITQYRPPDEKVDIKTENNGKKKKKRRTRRLFKFKVGDHVRISQLRQLFEKEYDERWTGEVFVIRRRFTRQNFPQYELEDIEGKGIVGNFYQMELQKVHYDPDASFKIEKVLKTRKRKGHEKESLIRWLHWPRKFDSWIPSSQVTGI